MKRIDKTASLSKTTIPHPQNTVAFNHLDDMVVTYIPTDLAEIFWGKKYNFQGL